MKLTASWWNWWSW